MKWFKHISDSLDDPFIFELVSTFGGDGYLVFFGCLEVMAREFHPDFPETCTVSERFLTKKLQISRKTLVKILTFCEKNNRIFAAFENGSVALRCPKFLDMCDEWTRKQLRSCSGVTPKILRPDLEVEEEGDKEKELRPPIAPHGVAGVQAKTQAKTIVHGEQHTRFNEFWKSYPKKRSKGQAEKAWSKIKPDAELFAAMMQGLDRAKRCLDWLKDGGQYIPYPATWLNAKGWEDDYDRGGSPLLRLSSAGQQQALNCQDFLEAGNGK